MKALIPALLIATISHAQTLHWANGYGGIGGDKGNAIAVDADGNTLLTGSFSNSFEFGAGSGITLTSAGGVDIFVAKVGPDGTLAWAFGMGGAWDDTGNDIATDPQGNVYVTGSFRGTDVDFDPGPNIGPLSSQTFDDMFVCKYDAAGGLIWAYSFGASAAYDWGKGIAVDDSGNVFVTGRFAGTVDFDAGPDVHSLNTGTGSYDAFVLALDTDGNYRWAIHFPGSSVDDGHAIALDADANVFVAGEFLGTVDLDPGPNAVNVGNAGAGSDAFICKLDPDGNYMWAATLVTTSGSDQVVALAADGQGNVHAAGEFNGDPLTISTPSDTLDIPYEGAIDAFVVKLQANGGLAWVGTLAGPQAQHAYAVTVDQGGYVYTTGYVNSGSVTDFDPGPGSYVLSASDPSMFLSVLDPDGQFACAVITAPAAPWNEGDDIAVDGNGNLYMTGWFSGTTDLDLSAGGTTELQTAGSEDIFLLKMTSSCSIILNTVELPTSTLLIAPNPARDVLVVQIPDPSSNQLLQVFSLTGKQVLAQTSAGTTAVLDVSGLAPGVYMIKPAGGLPPMRFVKQ